MKLKHLSFILLFVSIAFPHTHQIMREELIMDHVKNSMKLDELLMNSLSFLQQKVTNGTFKEEDMRVLNAIKKFIVAMKEAKNIRRTKERTVYWLLRQGR